MTNIAPRDKRSRVKNGRRSVLVLLAGALAGSSLYWLHTPDRKSQPESGSGGVPLLQKRVVPYWNAAIVIGRSYLKQYPHEDDYQHLVNALSLSEEVVGGRMSYTEIKAQQAGLRKRHQADFAAGRTVLLAGWILSLTEVRLAALIAKVTNE